MPKASRFEEPSYWDEHRTACLDYRHDSLSDYRRYCDWFTGHNGSLGRNLRATSRGKVAAPLSNLTGLATLVAKADLHYRAPRFLVKPIAAFGPSIFGPKLASVETMLLNDAVEEVGLYQEGDRAIVDFLLGPEATFKVGYSADIGTDDDLIQAQLALAQSEDRAILMGGKPRIKPTDYNRGHFEQHQVTLAAIERGDIEAPKSVINYLKKHMKFHADAMKEEGARPFETVRSESVFVKRVSPLRLFSDIMAENAHEKKWWQEAYLRAVDDVRADEQYDKSARETVEAAEMASETGGEVDDYRFAGIVGRGPDDYTVLFDTIDLERGKIITHAKGGSKPLLVRDYKAQKILPSGNYIQASAITDPIGDQGSPPPRGYESMQRNLTVLDQVIAECAKRSIPKMVMKKGMISVAEMKKIEKGLVNQIITLSDTDLNTDINKVFQQVPTPVLGEFVFAARSIQENGIERQTGGSARMGGGDTSKTATASAVVQESGSNVAESRAAIWDDFMSRTGRAMLRYMRWTYPQVKVAEICGEGAIAEGGWPLLWSVRDIVRDRGAEVVPGSSRRKNIAVEQKMGLELYAILSKDPMVPGDVKVEALQRLLGSFGQHGFDLSEMKKNLAMQEIQQLMAGSMGGEGGEAAAPAAGGPASRPGRRASTRGEGTPSAQRQGAANVGGGRVPTGASKGDAMRLQR